MVSRTLRVLSFVLFPAVVFGQSINVSATSRTAANNPSTFLLQDNKVTITDNKMRFAASGHALSGYRAYGISPDGSTVGLLKQSGKNSEMVLLDTEGDTLYSYSGSQLSTKDPSLNIYPFNNGDLLLRENISHFTFYDSLGDIYKNVSNSSGSKEGETISRVAMNPTSETVVLYNPKIKRNGELGSKAQVMTANGKLNTIYASRDRYLKSVSVSEDGNVVAAITAKSGTRDRVLIMDKFGNELNTISTDENLQGVSLTSDLDYITLYSGRRVMVYEMLSGERLGATSFRSPVFLADYFASDHMLLVLTGNYSEEAGMMRGTEFQAIDLEKRAIASKAFSGVLGFTKALTPRIVRTGNNSYRLEGANKQIRIEVSF